MAFIAATLLPMFAHADPSVADCQTGDVPGGWPTNSCSNHCFPVAPWTDRIQCHNVPNGGSTITDDTTIYVTEGAGSDHDFLVFGTSASYDYCCRIVDDDDELEILRVYGSDGDDTIDADGYSTLGQAADTWLLSGEPMPVLWLAGSDGDNDYVGSDDADLTEFYLGGLDVDTIVANDGNAWVRGGPGDDVITTGAGDDEIFGDISTLLEFGASCFDSPTYTDGNDTIVAGTGEDVIHGCGGNDTIFGGDVTSTPSCVQFTDAADEIFGGEGMDTIRGCDGDDTIEGGDDDDDINGNRGSDAITGNDGDDVIKGGNDDDFLCDDDSSSGGVGGDDYQGGNGNDEIFHDDSGDPDTLTGNGGTDDCTSTGVTVCENTLPSEPPECSGFTY